MRVLVCGGREYDDIVRVANVLDTLHTFQPIDLLVHGDAGKFHDFPDMYKGIDCGFWIGADKQASEWARKNNVPEKRYKPDWKQYGRKAGPVRNQQMLDEQKPDLVIAFPGGRGTADMVKRARAGGYKVYQVGES